VITLTHEELALPSVGWGRIVHRRILDRADFFSAQKTAGFDFQARRRQLALLCRWLSSCLSGGGFCFLQTASDTTRKTRQTKKAMRIIAFSVGTGVSPQID